MEDDAVLEIDGGEDAIVARQLKGDRGRQQRSSNWTKKESIVLARAMAAFYHEVDLATKNGRAIKMKMKWQKVSEYCAKEGVIREPRQCKKRWNNLSGEFKKIKDWESHSGHAPYWVMSSLDRRDTKSLPMSFDREIFDAIDGCVGWRPAMAAMPPFDSERMEESMHSEGQHQCTSHDEAATHLLEPPQRGHIDLSFEPSLTGVPVRDREPKLPTGKRRRRYESQGGESISERVVAAFESSTRMMEQIADLDREQREKQGIRLTQVISEGFRSLSSALDRIADKL